MDHHYIEEYNIADRYLQGKLSSTERARFEEHFVDCAECLDRLEMTDDFRRTLRTVAAEEAASARVHPQPSLGAWLMSRGGWKPAIALAAVLVLLVALPSTILITERSRREVNQALQSSAEWQRRYEESQQTALNLGKEMQTLETQLKEAQAAVEGSRPAQPQTTAPEFALHIVRSAPAGQSALANQISIRRSSPSIVLRLEIEPDPELQSYRLTLLTAGQQVVLSASDLMPVKDVLRIICDSSLFKSGDYRLTLEGLTRQDRYVSTGVYSFHVTKQ